jgi:ATP-dependent RNA helicase DDX19/DBP5
MTSLESRISKPETEKDGAPESWADATSAAEKSQPSVVDNKAEDKTSLSKAQTDGATEAFNGASGIYEPNYEVDVQLSDLQADPNNPLNSIKTFEELGL